VLLVTYVSVGFVVVAYAGPAFLAENADTFYYALTGVACAVYYRAHLTESVRYFVLVGLGPLVGAGLPAWLLVEAVSDMADPANSYSGVSWFGLGPPLAIGIGSAATGVVLMAVRRLMSPDFWPERPGVADPGLDHAKGPCGTRPWPTPHKQQ
jgi:hypothetical protein